LFNFLIAISDGLVCELSGFIFVSPIMVVDIACIPQVELKVNQILYELLEPPLFVGLRSQSVVFCLLYAARAVAVALDIGSGGAVSYYHVLVFM
jgi:hypothetical protein